MIEQVVNMKKRYTKLVEQFTMLEFEAYFAEFFARHQCVQEFTWTQEDNCGKLLINNLEFLLSPGYLQSHPTLKAFVNDRGRIQIQAVNQWRTPEYQSLYEAAVDVYTLLEAEDVLDHVFGRDLNIRVDKNGFTNLRWERI